MPREHLNQSVDQGFTLLELMVTLSIATVLLTMGVPSFMNFFDAQKLKGATEQVYSQIRRARIEALSRKTEVGVNFSVNSAEDWAYGVSDSGDGSCDARLTDPAEDDACTLVVDDGDGEVHGLDSANDSGDKVLMRFSAADHDSIGMTLNFANPGKIVFDPLLGTAMDASGNDSTGEIRLQSKGGRQLMIKVMPLGQVRICTPDGSMHGYSEKC